MAFKIYNTLNRKKEEFIPINDNEVGIYTCGPTVYNFAHIGNLRSFMFEDILRRALKFHGFKIKQVMNLTDVEDKTIRDSKIAGEPLKQYTEKFKKAFFEDIDTLNIERAEVYPAATDHIKEMIKLIQILIAKGFGYQTEDGSVYFAINKFPDYGKLAKIDMKNQRIGERVKSDEYEKDSVADFALWKAWTEEDGDVYWDSPWGRGRPGWHIECSAMSMKYLGKTFDLHTGGIDNMFPHHEDEIAQSEAANGKTFVNYWMHCEYLLVDNKKMSKSLGNFYTLRDLLNKNIMPEAIRWVLISTHYRKKLNFTFKACEQATEALKGFNNMFMRLNDITNTKQSSINIEAILKGAIEEFTKCLGDDLNISGTIGAVFNLQKEVNKLLDSNSISVEDAQKIIETYKKFNKVLGVFKFKDKKIEVPEKIIRMAEERQSARKNKDFAKADELRDEIKENGWQVEDTPDGPRIIKI
ncbi:MAG: cysteine--tRNA ligase [Victivallales bacterium]|nr:cysteine--tRNA ligase [Victivallales bacterium]